MNKLFVIPDIGEIEYEEKPFESQCFENRTFEILNWQSENGDISGLFRQFETTENLKKGDLFFTRFPVNNAKKSKEARSIGFYFMEVSIEPYIIIKDWKEENFATEIFELKKIGFDRLDEVSLIGEKTLTGLRFNRDDAIGEELAQARYKKWIFNTFNEGQDVVALIVDDEIVGFLTIRLDSSKSASWILGGVKSQYKGKRYGLKTYASGLAYCKQKGFEEVKTGANVGNVPMINLYSKLGFKFKNPSAVMHYAIT